MSGISSRLLFRIIKKLRLREFVNSRIHYTSKVEAGSSIVNSFFDRYSFCGYDCTIINASIGSFVCIADSVSIGLAAHPLEYVSMSTVFLSQRDSVRRKLSRHSSPCSSRRTFIGSDVWIGKSALIKQGVSIGTGAVVGMGSVVTKDVPPYAIVVGNPARIIRYRFDKEKIDLLLDSKWWTFDVRTISYAAQSIDDISEFIRKLLEA
jgi:acetyltransferase-like isoleucine patch superfamily enzyme